MTPTSIEFALVGPSGEPVNFMRTIAGHGVTDLPPMTADLAAGTLSFPVMIPERAPVVVTVDSPAQRTGRVKTPDVELDSAEQEAVLAATRHILRLDQDLSGFY